MIGEPETHNEEMIETERLAVRLSESVSPTDIKLLLGLPDIPELDPLEQIDRMFSPEIFHQDNLLNKLLLAGLTVHKLQDYEHAQVPFEVQLPFMGSPLHHIAGRLARQNIDTLRRIKRADAMMALARHEFYMTVISGEGAEVFHPKICYWYSSSARWQQSRYQNNIFFMRQLSELKSRSIELMLLTHLQA